MYLKIYQMLQDIVLQSVVSIHRKYGKKYKLSKASS